VLQPYKLVKDVRTEHETSSVDDVLNGYIDEFLKAYLMHCRAEPEGVPQHAGCCQAMELLSMATVPQRVESSEACTGDMRSSGCQTK
jgi:hypothetical protein